MFVWGPSKVRIQCVLEASLRDQRLFGTEQFSIGGRYSVRGFSGEENL